MDHTSKHKGANQRLASIDGFVSNGRTLGEPVNKPYQPSRGKPTPTLDNLVRRDDGFHAARPYAAHFGQIGQTAEFAEAEALLDEPIILDDEETLPRKRARGRRRPAIKKALKLTFLTAMASIAVLGGFLGWKVEHNISKTFHGNLLGILHTTKLKGEDKGRVNILIAGNSADDPGHDGANLTDSIMLVSLDTVHNNGYILSIPRDLWVNYGTNDCSLGYQGKINAVYECGKQIKFQGDGLPDGGMGLLEQNIEENLGVNINYYSLIDYTALRDGVNDVGGINFTVNSSNPKGIYDPSIDFATHGPLVKLSNGTHLLNGEQALDLARARGDAYGSYGFPQADFNRTQNQRQMLLNLKTKSLSAGVLSNPAKVSGLLDALGNNVQTDFKTSEIRRLYELSKKIPNSNLQSVGFADKNVNLVKSANMNGQSALVPTAGEGDFSQIQSFIKRLNSNDPVARENASIEVLNGTNVSGLAAKTGNNLDAKGLNVKGVASDTAHPTTTIVDLNPQKTATKTLLEQTFHVTSTTNATAYPETKNYNADFVIILGEDAAAATQNQTN